MSAGLPAEEAAKSFVYARVWDGFATSFDVTRFESEAESLEPQLNEFATQRKRELGTRFERMLADALDSDPIDTPGRDELWALRCLLQRDRDLDHVPDCGVLPDWQVVGALDGWFDLRWEGSSGGTVESMSYLLRMDPDEAAMLCRPLAQRAPFVSEPIFLRRLRDAKEHRLFLPLLHRRLRGTSSPITLGLKAPSTVAEFHLLDMKVADFEGGRFSEHVVACTLGSSGLKEEIEAVVNSLAADEDGAPRSKKPKRGRKPTYDADEDRELIDRQGASGMTEHDFEVKNSLKNGDMGRTKARERKRRGSVKGRDSTGS